jgi:hypothetical protein
MVPSAGNRRALIERGDADISFDLPNKDFRRTAQAGKLNIVSTPIGNGIQYIGMNVTKAPFDNVEGAPGGGLRHSLPEDHGRGAVRPRRPLHGAPADKATEAVWPQPHGYDTDMAKAKAAAGRGRLPQRLRDHAVLRSRLRRGQRAAVRSSRRRASRRSASRRRSTRSRAPTGAPSSTRRRCR